MGGGGGRGVMAIKPQRVSVSQCLSITEEEEEEEEEEENIVRLFTYTLIR